MNLSVIIPAFNEVSLIKDTVTAVKEYLTSQWSGQWEIIVVNDGSTDQTGAELSKLELKNLRVINLPVNQGKGAALIAGSQAAQGELWLWMDGDHSAHISELAKLTPYLNEADIIFGSRALTGSTITVHQPWYREVLGKMGNLVIQLLVLPGVKDSQCGFKLLNAAAARLVAELRTQKFGIDVELLALARRRGLRIKEVPINWHHEAIASVRLKSYLATLGEVIKIAWRLKITN